MFKKILIANRGEIACRVMRTARAMGIRTVAVYSEADRNARHVELADEAVPIGPAPSQQSYLSSERLIAACRQTGAEAVHPGYGFLSENAAFAREVEQAGIVFIGPTAGAIAAMGDKIASKKLAARAKVNTIPGHDAAIEDADEAVRIARAIGYPVMIKASAGGGGKGLRVARDDGETRAGFISCRNEARGAFGDDRVFIERFIEQPRHIEIQVLGDAHGHVVYLWERECSIQRRHQKVLEEAPSPFLDPSLREAMGKQAVALAKAVRYQSAGTVEFVVGSDRSFYFLEMNTRLQVEHPVTEMITGLDLVELMIRVAAGETLPFKQQDIKLDGWALECRINAEDPFRGFLPSTGRLVRYLPPADVPGALRVDTGVAEGGEISIHYDSMIAKVITHGPDRATAIERMRTALDAFIIRGVAANVAFHAALLRQANFERGTFDTGFIAASFPNGFDARSIPHEDPLLWVVVGAAIQHTCAVRDATISGQLPGHEYTPEPALVVIMEGRHYETIVESGAAGCTVQVAERRYQVVTDWAPGQLLFRASIDAFPLCVQVDADGLALHLTHAGRQVALMVMPRHAAALHALMPRKAPPDLSRFLLSPMPGLLTELAVSAGQEVKAGDKLAVIEAMKMENVLKAERDATVAELLAKPGESLSVDQAILRFH